MGFLDFLKKQPPQPIEVAMPSSPSDNSSSIQPPSTTPEDLPPILGPADSKDWDPFSNLNNDLNKTTASSANPTLAMKPLEEIEIPLPQAQSVPSNEVDIPLPPMPPPSRQSEFALPQLPDIASSSDFFATAPISSTSLTTSQQTSSQSSSRLSPVASSISSQSIDLPDFTDDEIAALEAIQKSIHENTANTSAKNNFAAPLTPLPFTTQSTSTKASLLDMQPIQSSSDLKPATVIQKDVTKNEALKTMSFSSEEEIVRAPANAVAMPKDTLTLPVGITVESEDLIPAKFISSADYFNIKLEIKALRKSLRSNDDITKDGVLRHEQLDVLYKKISQDFNNFENSIMKIDHALFEE